MPLPNYKKAYNILMDYWDYLPEEERLSINEKLEAALWSWNKDENINSK